MEGAAGKRKDLMDNIKSRLNSGSYNVEQFYKKNEKDLKDKVKFFEKKIAAGEMKPFMSPRFEQAKVMLAKLMAIKGLAAAPVPAGAPAAAAAAANLNAPLNLLAPEASVAEAPAVSLVPAAVASAPKKARTYRKKTVVAPAQAVPVTVGEPPVSLNQPLRIRIPTTRRGRPKAAKNSLRVKPFESAIVPGAKLSGIPEVSSANEAGSPLFASNAAANAGSLALPNLLSVPAAAAAPAPAPKPYNPFNSPVGSPASAISVGQNVGQSRRRQRMPQVMNEYLLRAISETEHLIPEMYDPYTGLKFGPDESPMDKIEQAYRELQQLRAATWKKASTYRRKAAKKGGKRR
jgi:hypothetical protein